MVAYSQPSRNGHKALPTSHLEALAAQSELAAVDAALASLRDLPPGAPLSAVERALRLLEAATLWLDPLGRAMLREALLHELKRIGVSSPARLADIALGDEERHDTEGRAGQVVDLEDPQPWPETVHGADLLDELVTTIRRYVVLPSEHHAAAIALWVAHTWTLEAFAVTPRLAITSPTRRCGKTTLLTLLGALVRRPLPSSNITSAALFRAIEAFSPTVLIDEADTFLAYRDELRGLLNAGHHRAAAWVVRTVGDDHEVRRFFVFAPVAIAAIGSLPDALTDRSIRIEMVRRRPDEEVDPLRLDRLADFQPLRRKLARWTADNLEALHQADPAVPEGLHDRAADNWRPLLAIADAAGGHWPASAREVARTLEGTADGEDADVRVQLLADLKALFDERGAEMLDTNTILEALHGMEDRPWAEWSRGQPMTAQGLARLLKPFGVRPGQKASGPRDGRKVVRGYYREALESAWARYLPAHAGETKPLHPLHLSSDGLSGDSTNRYTTNGVADTQSGANPHHDGGVAGVADASYPYPGAIPWPSGEVYYPQRRCALPTWAPARDSPRP